MRQLRIAKILVFAIEDFNNQDKESLEEIINQYFSKVDYSKEEIHEVLQMRLCDLVKPDEITREWLDAFSMAKANGTLTTPFWQLAVRWLPLGVNPQHPEVQKAIFDIQSVNYTESTGIKLPAED